MDPAFLHSIVGAVFVIFVFGAVTVFHRAPGGAARDPRAVLMTLLFWGLLASTFGAHLAAAPLVVVALVLLALSLLLFFWAAISIRGKVFSYAYTHDTPAFLHTSGPYAYVRNPFYDSYLLATIGSLLMWPTWAGAALGAAMVLYFNSLAKFEERKFEASPLRAEYAQYKARTGRLLPRLSH